MTTRQRSFGSKMGLFVVLWLSLFLVVAGTATIVDDTTTVDPSHPGPMDDQETVAGPIDGSALDESNHETYHRTQADRVSSLPHHDEHSSAEHPTANDAVTLTRPPSSPECWLSAISLFQTIPFKQNHHHHHSQHYFASDLHQDDTTTFTATATVAELDATKLCQYLPEQYQKRLALEIARCHLQDVGRPLFINATVERRCVLDPTDDNNDDQAENVHPNSQEKKRKSGADIKWCLKQLTDYGVNAYTHHFAYVSSLCIRLTQELVVAYQQQTQRDLALRYAEISSHSLEQLTSMSRLTQKHAEQLQALAQIPQQVTERLTNHLQTTVRDTIQHSMSEQIAHQLQGLFTVHTQGLEHHLAKLEAQREEMEAAVRKTKQSMQPILQLQSLLATVTQRYEWLTFWSRLLGAMYLVWLMTRPQCGQPVRWCLMGIVVAEALWELILRVMVNQALLSASNQTAYVATARQWSFILMGAFYVLGLLASLAGLLSSATKTENSSKTEEEMLSLRRQKEEEFMTRLEATLQRVTWHPPPSRGRGPTSFPAAAAVPVPTSAAYFEHGRPTEDGIAPAFVTPRTSSSQHLASNMVSFGSSTSEKKQNNDSFTTQRNFVNHRPAGATSPPGVARGSPYPNPAPYAVSVPRAVGWYPPHPPLPPGWYYPPPPNQYYRFSGSRPPFAPSPPYGISPCRPSPTARGAGASSHPMQQQLQQQQDHQQGGATNHPHTSDDIDDYSVSSSSDESSGSRHTDNNGSGNNQADDHAAASSVEASRKRKQDAVLPEDIGVPANSRIKRYHPNSSNEPRDHHNHDVTLRSRDKLAHVD